MTTPTKTIDITITITLDATDLIDRHGEERARAMIAPHVRGAFFDSDIVDELMGLEIDNVPVAYRSSKVR